MDNHGSCIWGVAGLDPTKEGQERGWVLRHTVVRPGRELEVTDFALLIGAALDRQTDRQKIKLMFLYGFSLKIFQNMQKNMCSLY